MSKFLSQIAFQIIILVLITKLRKGQSYIYIKKMSRLFFQGSHKINIMVLNHRNFHQNFFLPRQVILYRE